MTPTGSSSPGGRYFFGNALILSASICLIASAVAVGGLVRTIAEIIQIQIM